MEGESARVEGLQPSTLYTFTVAAENRVGSSLPSEPVSKMTLEEKPTGFPRNLKVNGLHSDISLI